MVVAARRRRREPRMGTSNQKTPTRVTMSTSTYPIRAKGNGFAQDELEGPDGGDDELLHGADLPLPDDGHAGQHKGDQHDQEGHDAGDVEVPALQVGVEEGPGLHVDSPLEEEGLLHGVGNIRKGA